MVSCLFIFNKARAQDIVYISQVQITGGSGKTANDFIELFNPGMEPLNLKGYRLVKRTVHASEDTLIKSWTEDILIPAKSFYLWANSNFVELALLPNATTTGSLADDNGIAVRFGPNDTGEIIDSIAWGLADNGFKNVSAINPKANQALWRQNLFQADAEFIVASSSPRNSSVVYQENQPEANSQQTATTTPESQSQTNLSNATTTVSQNQNAGGGANFAAKSSFVKISELLPNPQGEDSGQEMVELINTGKEAADLDGWILGDKSDSGVKSNAYKIMGQILPPGQVLTITIPKGHFALNNTGGDVLNLYFADQTLADSVAYKEAAEEGLSYQKVGETWLWGPSSPGQINSLQSGRWTGRILVLINELMPNPEGGDEGQEWVEIYNPSDIAVNLKGFILDDEGTSDQPGSGAWVLDETVIVPAKGLVTLKIPEDSFVLNNNHDEVRLFDPNKNLIESIAYTGAPEGQSYARSEQGQWFFGPTTFGQPNLTKPLKYYLVISELLPNPETEDEEFLEIQNQGAEKVNLKGIIIKVGTKTKTISDDTVLNPNDFYTFYEKDLPARLKNLGQTATLIDPWGEKAAEVTYKDAKSGQAFALNGQGEYKWTAQPTPGAENVFVLGAVSVLNDNKSQNSAKDQKANVDDLDPKVSSVALSTSRELNQKIAALEAKIDALTMALSQNSQEKPLEALPDTSPAESASLLADEPGKEAKWYLGATLLALLLFIWLLKSYILRKR